MLKRAAGNKASETNIVDELFSTGEDTAETKKPPAALDNDLVLEKKAGTSETPATLVSSQETVTDSQLDIKNTNTENSNLDFNDLPLVPRKNKFSTPFTNDLFNAYKSTIQLITASEAGFYNLQKIITEQDLKLPSKYTLIDMTLTKLQGLTSVSAMIEDRSFAMLADLVDVVGVGNLPDYFLLHLLRITLEVRTLHPEQSLKNTELC